MDKIEIRPMDSAIETMARASVSASPAGSNGSCSCQGHNCPQDDDPEGHVYYSRCEEAKVHDLPDTLLANTGRVLDVTLTLKRICPCRRVAVGIFVTEVDNSGNEYSRGFKAITVPAHHHFTCKDVDVPTTRFILPEDLRVDGGTTLCDGCRHFVVRSEAHYIDSSVTVS